MGNGGLKSRRLFRDIIAISRIVMLISSQGNYNHTHTRKSLETQKTENKGQEEVSNGRPRGPESVGGSMDGICMN